MSDNRTRLLKGMVPALGVALVLGLAACDNPAAPDPAELQGTWRLISLQEPGAPPLSITDPAQFTATFDAEGRLQLKADCNVCSGRYEATETTIAVGAALACTKAYCASAPLDDRYLTLLAAAQTWRVNGQLELASPAGTLRFVR